MNSSTVNADEERLLILAPVGRDSNLIVTMLRPIDVHCHACGSFEELALEVRKGAAAILIAEEALGDFGDRLAAIMAQQPPWSDLPILLLTRTGADSVIASHSLATLGNVTLLERPVRVSALTSSIRSALRVRQRQYQTRGYLQELEQTDRRKDQFLATLAHELRNPLAPILNAIHLLRLSDVDASTRQIRQILERQVNQMVRLVDDLLDVSRITRGAIELHREATDLAVILAAAVETSRPLIDSAGHQLSIECTPKSLIVDVDAMRLAQVFSNLLNNAAKYTDPGGRIAVTAERDDGSVVVTISDNGIGIPDNAIARVFDIFAQADAHDYRAQTGLGVGLALARSLVEMHGGTLSVKSEGKGKGSAFTVRLPAAVAAVTAAPGVVARPATPPTSQQRVLLVDDNRDAADTLGALLELHGSATHVVYSGAEALAAIGTFAPAVVVLDLGMPEMDGYEVARRIRGRDDCAQVTLIALTGWGQESDRSHTEAAGFHCHLTKPVDIGEMQRILAAVRSPG